MIVTTLDTITSVLAGCTVFAVLGHLMDHMGEDNIDEVAKEGPGIAFVIYAKVIETFYAVPQVSYVLCIRVG
jgi:solute carrier family 6 amino acid transporter-like protein 5/7/9/14